VLITLAYSASPVLFKKPICTVHRTLLVRLRVFVRSPPHNNPPLPRQESETREKEAAVAAAEEAEAAAAQRAAEEAKRLHLEEVARERKRREKIVAEALAIAQAQALVDAGVVVPGGTKGMDAGAAAALLTKAEDEARQAAKDAVQKKVSTLIHSCARSSPSNHRKPSEPFAQKHSPPFGFPVAKTWR
jgi:hypothetical protein